MSPVVKNVLTLLFFVMFVSWIGRAEAADSEEYERMFFKTIPDHWMVNFTSSEKCMYRRWKWCPTV